ncbi:AimR family lysis-lysogeny pheromone receptor [Gracilibacillus marinus]|uniref:AimR family lysis-lysogeny pheromone receptor n=1 Tax=Gracilibacillus marinus TaxID=630535 RepID=A0ABV8VQJ3_9BACI
MTRDNKIHPIMEQFLNSSTELPLYVIYQQIKAQPDEIDTMRLICLHCKDASNQHVAMEYLYTNGLYEDLHTVIEKNRSSIHSTIRNYALLYQIMYERKTLSKKQIKPDAPMRYVKMSNRIDSTSTDNVFHILKDLIHIYSYFDVHQYGKIGNYNDRIKERLDMLTDPLLRELLEARLDETLCIYHWKRNEVILSRKYGYKLLANTNNQRKKIDLHNIFAQTYVLESYEQAIHHATVALELAESIQDERAIYGLENYTIPFISSYHGKTDEVKTEDVAEQAHLALRKGDNKTCIELLEALPTLTPFQEYYLGLAKKDKALLRQSYRHFIEERDDYFYARLPLLALQEMDQ